MAGDMVNNLMVPLAGWTVPRPVFKRYEVVTKPTVYPVDVTTLKSHLRITHTSDDAYLTTLIKTATAIAEKFTNRKFISTPSKMWMDFIPGTGNEYTLYGAGTAQVPVRYANIGMFRWFELLYSPVASVDSIHFISNDGSDNVFDASQYIIDRVDQDSPARICLQRGTVWPVDLQVAHSLYVNYTVGYGPTAADVPPEIAHVVMIAAAALWSNRGDDADPQSSILAMPNVRSILSQHRIMSMGVM